METGEKQRKKLYLCLTTQKLKKNVLHITIVRRWIGRNGDIIEQLLEILKTPLPGQVDSFLRNSSILDIINEVISELRDYVKRVKVKGLSCCNLKVSNQYLNMQDTCFVKIIPNVWVKYDLAVEKISKFGLDKVKLEHRKL